MNRISSRSNPLWKNAQRLLHSSRHRHTTGKMVIEGVKLVTCFAQARGLEDATLLVNEDAVARNDIQALFQKFPGAGLHLVSQALFLELSELDSPEGVLAISDIPETALPPRDHFRLLIEGIQDPGNLGSLLRSAAAAQVSSIWLSKQTADVWSPKCLRGGMGAQFELAIRQDQEPSEMLKGFSGLVLATDARSETSLFEIDMRGPVALIFGSEGNGLSREFAGLAARSVRIPMSNRVESLNVAAAATICMFERVRQLGQGSKTSGDGKGGLL
ncbi:MAG: TrmH family RNA methyltransferase [Burkholderiales bacterium]